MDIIHLLPDNVANQIAAGEVIQRPSSCLKELAENALDAKADKIQVIVQDAGRTLLQVIDNGVGMSETDVRMAFERHATSKISKASDLFSLKTMGFRGEALASICAIAQVEVTTRREQDQLGTRLEIDGSKVQEQESVQCPVGTNIKVKNLFYNVPVRRKFLKSDQTEFRNILNEFYRIALVYPKVAFVLVHNDELILELNAGTEKQRIEAIFGKSSRNAYTANFVEIAADTEIVSIRGFIGKPEFASKNHQQYFFVNGRYMRHPYFHKAVLNAYSGMLQQDTNPSYFIYFEVNPDTIDVNIHPTKTEIKFADDQLVFQILLATVRESLGKFNIAPSLDFDVSGKIEMPILDSSSIMSKPVCTRNVDYNPFKQSNNVASSNWQTLYSKSDDYPEQIISEVPKQTAIYEDEIWWNSPIQYVDKYICVASSIGLLVIDQHRAHQAILYHQYIQQILDERVISQQLLFPEIWELNAENMMIVMDALDELHSVGFDLSQFSKTSFSINGIPPNVEAANAKDVLQEILNQLQDSAKLKDIWREQIAKQLALHTAIPYGKHLTEDEMQDIISRLFKLSTYRYTPEGKKIIYVLSEDEIGKNLLA